MVMDSTVKWKLDFIDLGIHIPPRESIPNYLTLSVSRLISLHPLWLSWWIFILHIHPHWGWMWRM